MASDKTGETLVSGGDVWFPLIGRDKTRSGSGQSNHSDLACAGGFHPPNLPGCQRTHFPSGVVNLLSAVQAHQVRLVLEGERTCHPGMAAAKEDFRKEAENRMQAANTKIHGTSALLSCFFRLVPHSLKTPGTAKQRLGGPDSTPRFSQSACQNVRPYPFGLVLRETSPG